MTARSSPAVAFRASSSLPHPSFDGCKLVHKSCNSFSSCSAGFPPRFSGLLPVAWLRRCLVNCAALCSAPPFVPAQHGSCCPGICHVLVVNRSEETALRQAGVPPEWQGGGKVRRSHKGTELIYATSRTHLSRLSRFRGGINLLRWWDHSELLKCFYASSHHTPGTADA